MYSRSEHQRTNTLMGVGLGNGLGREPSLCSYFVIFKNHLDGYMGIDAVGPSRV